MTTIYPPQVSTSYSVAGRGVTKAARELIITGP